MLSRRALIVYLPAAALAASIAASAFAADKSVTVGLSLSLTAGGFTTDATVTPISVVPGAAATIAVSVTSSAASTDRHPVHSAAGAAR